MTHRVVEILRNDDGTPAFRTRGDANEEVDRHVVPLWAVKGKVVFSLPYVGYAHEMVATRNGVFLITFVVGLLTVVNEVWSFKRNSDPRRGALERRRQLRAR